MEASLRPHRAGTVLTLGILGLVPILGVIPFGIPAWIMASNDLRDMKAGSIDPAGRNMTQAARVCGIVATGLWVIGMFLILISYGGRDAWHPA